MSITRAYAILLRQFYLVLHGKMRIMDIFYWPLLDLFLWGFITIYLARLGGPSFHFISILIGTLIFWYFFTRIQYGVIISFLEDIWTRNFANLFSSPLSVGEYVAGLILSSIFRSSLSMVFMIIMAWVLFSYDIFQFGFLMIPFVCVLFIFGVGLGVMTTAIVLRFGPSSEFLAWSIPALLLPFSGVFYPISALPQWLQPVAYFLPSSYVFEGLRSAALGGVFDRADFLWALLTSLVVFLFSYWFIVRIYKIVLRRGLFTRFLTD